MLARPRAATAAEEIPSRSKSPNTTMCSPARTASATRVGDVVHPGDQRRVEPVALEVGREEALDCSGVVTPRLTSTRAVIAESPVAALSASTRRGSAGTSDQVDSEVLGVMEPW